MGWFSDVDYKRMLLLYDEILYLIPSATVEFQDVTGKSASIVYGDWLKTSAAFKVLHARFDADVQEHILHAAKADARLDGFSRAVGKIPAADRLYTWRAVNADADLGSSRSVAFLPEQEVEAHALLLNKFLLAADKFGAIPITGKGHVHAPIAQKYQVAAKALEVLEGAPLSRVHRRDLQHGPVVAGISSVVIPDDELERKSMDEIADFKNGNRELFERFSYLGRQAVVEISALPGDRPFHRELADFINTKLWKERKEVEEEIRAAWLRPHGLKRFVRTDPFKMGVKRVASGTALGVAPWIGLKILSFGTVLTAGGAVLPWAFTELLEAVDARRKLGRHGLYYLVKFAEGSKAGGR